MKESFYITAYRPHTKDSNQLLIMGYFSNNQSEGHQLVITLDELELEYSVFERKLKQHQFRSMNGITITKQFYLWVQFPGNWRTYQQLKISNIFEGKEECVATVSVSQIENLRKDVVKIIDKITVENDELRIEGWFISLGKEEIYFTDLNEKKLSMKIQQIHRPDVLWEYPENQIEEVHGFLAVYKGKIPEKVKVHFIAGEKYEAEILKIKDRFVEKNVKEAIVMIRKAANYYRQFGIKATILRAGDKLGGRGCIGYEDWLRRKQPSRQVLRKQSKHKFVSMPKISIVVPLYKTPEIYLKEMIDSVVQQSYGNWELCLSDGSGVDSKLTELLKKYEKKDERIHVVHNHRQLHISDNTNEALKIATGDYIAFLDHDDLLAPNALFECVCAMNEDPDIEMIYTDEDKINMDGTQHFLPHFKPDFNLDMLRSVNYFCHLVVVKRELLNKVGGLNRAYDGAQDHDFVLRCAEKTSKIKHIPQILYHWRVCEGSTAENAENKKYIVKAGMGALQAHLERQNIEAEVMPTESLGTYRVKYKLKDTPKVSVIIPNKDHIEDLDKCMRSLEEKNTYENIEYIIVENNSQEEATFEYYQELEQRNPKAKVLYWKGTGFNYPAINNYGVEHSTGEYVLLLNNDTEIINSDCIEEMLSICMRKDVGAVGAKLYYQDGTIQHAGVVIGLGGVAGHIHLGIPGNSPGYFGRAQMIQNLSAVTAACIMVKRSVYEEVGGLEEEYAVAFNDVDLCMKIRRAGYLIVYDPYAELMHYESKSRGYEDTPEKIRRFQKEIAIFQNRWEDILAEGDPYYNPNLTLDRNDFSINMNTKRERK